jgi:hypothetical protein
VVFKSSVGELVEFLGVLCQGVQREGFEGIGKLALHRLDELPLLKEVLLGLLEPRLRGHARGLGPVKRASKLQDLGVLALGLCPELGHDAAEAAPEHEPRHGEAHRRANQYVKHLGHRVLPLKTPPLDFILNVYGH